MFGVDEVAVFADPAEPRLLRPGLVHQRPTVYTGPPIGPVHLVLQPASQAPQATIDDPVVVPPPAVACHRQAAGLALRLDMVVKAHRQNTAYPWQ